MQPQKVLSRTRYRTRTIADGPAGARASFDDAAKIVRRRQGCTRAGVERDTEQQSIAKWTIARQNQP